MMVPMRIAHSAIELVRHAMEEQLIIVWHVKLIALFLVINAFAILVL
jgi:hypothetical protein